MPMKPIRSIVAATDFSRPGGWAVRRASMLANELPARLEVVHVVEGPGLTQVEAARRAHARIRTGRVLDELLAASKASDVLALGAHGTHRLRDLAIGSTAERLLHKGIRRMLVVKAAPRRPYRRIIVPIDFSADSIAAIDAALRIAPQATITLLHVYEIVIERKLWRTSIAQPAVDRLRREARTSAVTQLRELAARRGVRPGHFDEVVTRGYPARVILETARRRNADLIAIGRQGRSMLERLFIGSVTRHVLDESRCDVLVLREHS